MQVTAHGLDYILQNLLTTYTRQEIWKVITAYMLAIYRKGHLRLLQGRNQTETIFEVWILKPSKVREVKPYTMESFKLFNGSTEYFKTFHCLWLYFAHFAGLWYLYFEKVI